MGWENLNVKTQGKNVTVKMQKQFIECWDELKKKYDDLDEDDLEAMKAHFNNHFDGDPDDLGDKLFGDQADFEDDDIGRAKKLSSQSEKEISPSAPIPAEVYNSKVINSSPQTKSKEKCRHKCFTFRRTINKWN